jgi:hypothetical protein
MIEVLFPTEAKEFSLPHSVQAISEAHSALFRGVIATAV